MHIALQIVVYRAALPQTSQGVHGDHCQPKKASIEEGVLV